LRAHVGRASSADLFLQKPAYFQRTLVLYCCGVSRHERQKPRRVAHKTLRRPWTKISGYKGVSNNTLQWTADEPDPLNLCTMHKSKRALTPGGPRREQRRGAAAGDGDDRAAGVQFGRTSILMTHFRPIPRAPHLAHTTLRANHGTSVSPGYFDTSIKPWWRHASLRQVATSRCTPRWRMSPSVIGAPGGCFIAGTPTGRARRL
jgi:hypothetical protein